MIWCAGAHVVSYQCKFTYIDAKGNVDAKDFRMSAAVAAAHSRSFQCITPAWGKGGTLPPLAKWKTASATCTRSLPRTRGAVQARQLCYQLFGSTMHACMHA